MKFGFTDDYIIGSGGLALTGHLIKKLDFVRKVNNITLEDAKNPDIRHSDVLVSYLGLLCQGKNDFDHIEAYREDEFYRQALGVRRVPSSPTLRQRLDAAEDNFHDIIQCENAKLIRLGAHKITPCSTGHIPIDIDVSPFDNSNTKKEGVGLTYKMFDGYTPIFSYMGEEGFCINLQLREGTQHCQSETEDYLANTIKLAMMAYNILRILGQESINAPGIPLRKKAERRRIRTVIQNLITIAGKVVKHAGEIKLCFSRENRWAIPWMAINEILA